MVTLSGMEIQEAEGLYKLHMCDDHDHDSLTVFGGSYCCDP